MQLVFQKQIDLSVCRATHNDPDLKVLTFVAENVREISVIPQIPPISSPGESLQIIMIEKINKSKFSFYIHRIPLRIIFYNLKQRHVNIDNTEQSKVKLNYE